MRPWAGSRRWPSRRRGSAQRRPRPTWGLVEGDAIAPGRTVLRRIGGGRRYEVFLVWDEHRLAVLVAKVLRPDQAEDPVALRDLVREGDLLERIAHPVVVRGFGTRGATARSRTCCSSTSRARRCRRCWTATARSASSSCCRSGCTRASALHYLAREGVVHLDVKPDNLVMGAPPRLIDFSVSRGLVSAGAALQAGRHRRLHGPGAVRSLARRARPAGRRVRARRDDVPRARRASRRSRSAQGARSSTDPAVRFPQLARAPAPLPRRTPAAARRAAATRCSRRRPATARPPRRSSPRSSPSSPSSRGGSCSGAAAACAARFGGVLTFLGLSVLLILTPGPNQALLTSRRAERGSPGGLRRRARPGRRDGRARGGRDHRPVRAAGLLGAGIRRREAARRDLPAVARDRRDRPRPAAADDEAPARAGGSPFRDGLLSMTLNPKVGVYFVAVVPQFVAPGPGASLRVALLLVIYGALCLVFWTGFVVGLHHARELVRRPRVRAWTERVTGAALIGLARAWPPARRSQAGCSVRSTEVNGAGWVWRGCRPRRHKRRSTDHRPPVDRRCGCIGPPTSIQRPRRCRQSTLGHSCLPPSGRCVTRWSCERAVLQAQAEQAHARVARAPLPRRLPGFSSDRDPFSLRTSPSRNPRRQVAADALSARQRAARAPEQPGWDPRLRLPASAARRSRRRPPRRCRRTSGRECGERRTCALGPARPSRRGPQSHRRTPSRRGGRRRLRRAALAGRLRRGSQPGCSGALAARWRALRASAATWRRGLRLGACTEGEWVSVAREPGRPGGVAPRLRERALCSA